MGRGWFRVGCPGGVTADGVRSGSARRLGLAASLRAAGTAGCLLLRTSQWYAAAPRLWSRCGDPAAACSTVLIGINGFPSWVAAIRAVRAHCPHYLATYLHQLTSPSADPVSPQGSLLHRLAWLDGQARVASWSVGVHSSLLVRGAFAAVLGTVAGSAVHVRASRSCALLVRLCASSVLHLWIGWGSHGRGLNR